MKIDGFTHKILLLKEAFMTSDEFKGFRMGIIEDEENFKFSGRSVAIIIDSESISEERKKTIDVIYYFSKTKNISKDKILDFRYEVKQFLNFIETMEDNKISSKGFKIAYGSVLEDGKTSIRTASIKVTYDITRLRDVDLEDEDFELMKDLYIEWEVE